MHIILKVSGVILLVTGFLLAINPNLFDKTLLSTDAYQMIEKRAKWGVIIGMGIFLLFHSNWTSWGLIATVLLTTLTLGVVIARLMGFAFDGFFTKQLAWLLIELGALFVFGFLYYKQKV